MRSTSPPKCASSATSPHVARAEPMTHELDPDSLQALAARAISPPLVRGIHTADPSAHVFEGRLYIYPSHDIDGGVPADDLGSHYCMEDYHIFRQEHPGAEAVDCGL